MADPRSGGSARRPAEDSSLFGLVTFRPRLTIVLLFLTLTLGLVAFRILKDSGLRQVEGVAREATALFAAARKGDTGAASGDPGTIEAKIKEWAGVAIVLPRDEPLFSFGGVARETVARRTAAAVLFNYAGEPYLLVILRPDRLSGAGTSSSPFSESSFLSGEKEGKSFVYWERDGASFVLVSDVDLTRTFDLVRRYFT